MVKPKLYEFCCYDDYFNPYLDEEDVQVLIVTNDRDFREIRKRAQLITEKGISRWIRTYDISDIHGE